MSAKSITVQVVVSLIEESLRLPCCIEDLLISA